MRVRKLDHSNITAPFPVIEECHRLYTSVLGLTEGPGPPFRSTGFWLYADGHPLSFTDPAGVHIELNFRSKSAIAG